MLTNRQKDIIQMVYKNKNISQTLLAHIFKMSPRQMRVEVNAIRKSGVITLGNTKIKHFLIADNRGYALVGVTSERFINWQNRINAMILETKDACLDINEQRIVNVEIL